MRPHLVTGLVLAALLVAGCAGVQADGSVLRLAHFANLTHGQALYGTQMELFVQALGNGTRLEARVFNAGPAAFEALFAGQVDAAYVGPSPTLSALEHTGDSLIRIVAGAASGGARFVVRRDLALDAPEDYAGKRFASPQLGNTQDVALRHHLHALGIETRDAGGDVDVINAANPDILALFTQGQIDGAWVPEPWATRLLLEGGGRVAVNESDTWPDGRFVTTHLVVRKVYLERNPDVIDALVAAHVDATLRLQREGEEGVRVVNAGIKEATGKALADGLAIAAAREVDFTYEPMRASFEGQAQMSRDLDFLDGELPDLDIVYDLGPLQRALRERGLPEDVS